MRRQWVPVHEDKDRLARGVAAVHAEEMNPPWYDFIYSPDFWRQYGASLGGTATALAVALGLWWRLLEYRFDRLLKDYEYQLKIREKSAGVAELLSIVFSADYTPEKFNRLAWELSLWLPADIVCELTHCLCKSERNIQPKDVLIRVRKHLLGNNDTLIAENIVHTSKRARFNDKQQQKADEILEHVMSCFMALSFYFSLAIDISMSNGLAATSLSKEIHEAENFAVESDRALFKTLLKNACYLDDDIFRMIQKYRSTAQKALGVCRNPNPSQERIKESKGELTVERDAIINEFRRLL